MASWHTPLECRFSLLVEVIDLKLESLVVLVQLASPELSLLLCLFHLLLVQSSDFSDNRRYESTSGTYIRPFAGGVKTQDSSIGRQLLEAVAR
jgi:hypothetical protein